MSKTSKHTPGPWRIEEGTTVIWGACNPEDHSSYGMGYPITECRITPVSDSSWCKAPFADEGESNARLVSAAPDLLEALKDSLIMIARLKRHLRIVDNAGYTPDGRMLSLTMVEDAAAAAISKAEGLS